MRVNLKKFFMFLIPGIPDQLVIQAKGKECALIHPAILNDDPDIGGRDHDVVGLMDDVGLAHEDLADMEFAVLGFHDHAAFFPPE
jgi:hypothetical protein